MAITEDLDGKMWIGTYSSGIIVHDNNTWTKYDTSNSPIPIDRIWTIKVDAQNNKWFGTYGSIGGLVKFDGTNWEVFYLEEYGIDGNSIFDIEFDEDGNLWMGSYWNGLIKYDGSEFTLYNSQTTNLDNGMEEINCLEIDSSGHIWIGSDYKGAAVFDRVSSWTHFYESDNTVNGAIYTLDIDANQNKWFGGTKFLSKYNNVGGWKIYDYPEETMWPWSSIVESENKIWFSLSRGGFYKFESETWTHIYPSDQDLSEENSQACFKNSNGDIWIGYNNGHIAIYNESGLVSIKNDESVIDKFTLNQNYPNPFNPNTSITYAIPSQYQNQLGTNNEVKVILKIYNSIGQEITTLVNENKKPGIYEVVWDASVQPSGIYYYKLTSDQFSQTKKMILLK